MKVSGSFDNPSGFAVCLMVGLPFCWYFFNHRMKTFSYIAKISSVIIPIGIIFSGSRAGVIALLVTTYYYLSQQYSFRRIINKPWLKIVLPISIALLLTGLYFKKKDSADGRLFIWRNTLEMIKDAPIHGHGTGAFLKKYMDYQANYLSKKNNSRFEYVAGNVYHPFNEYLLFLVEHGIIGVVFIFASFFFIRKTWEYSDKNKIIPILIAICFVMGIFASFSYPFKYPFVWIISCLCLALFSSTQKNLHHTPRILSLII